jgi:hypothetical protein
MQRRRVGWRHGLRKGNERNCGGSRLAAVVLQRRGGGRIPDSGSGDGRKRHECGPSIGRIMAPGQENTRQGASPRCVGIRVQTELLRQEIAAQARGRARNWLIQPGAISMPPPERHTQMSLLFSNAHAAARPDGSWGIYGDVETFERAVAGWMASLLLDAPGALAVTQQSLHRLSLLDFWIERNLAEDITLDSLCAVACCRRAARHPSQGRYR